jgi:hypothetical protein
MAFCHPLSEKLAQKIPRTETGAEMFRQTSPGDGNVGCVTNDGFISAPAFSY